MGIRAFVHWAVYGTAAYGGQWILKKEKPLPSLSPLDFDCDDEISGTVLCAIRRRLLCCWQGHNFGRSTRPCWGRVQSFGTAPHVFTIGVTRPI